MRHEQALEGLDWLACGGSDRHRWYAGARRDVSQCIRSVAGSSIGLVIGEDACAL